jgi:hypothetical protein
MRAEFSFEIDPPHGLVRIVMSGFFTLSDVHQFLEGRREAHAALGCAPNQHLTLNDIRGMTAQPQMIVDAFEKLLAAPEARSRRLAFVVSSALARSQAFRALASRRARWFTDPAAAETWILTEGDGSAPKASVFSGVERVIFWQAG